MNDVIRLFEGTDLLSITRFQDVKTTIRATRRLYGKRIDKRGPVEILLRKGRPNFAERQILSKPHPGFPFTRFKKYVPAKRKPEK